MTENKTKREKQRPAWIMLSAVLLGFWGLFFSSFMADDFITLGMLKGVSPLPISVGPFTGRQGFAFSGLEREPVPTADHAALRGNPLHSQRTTIPELTD